MITRISVLIFSLFAGLANVQAQSNFEVILQKNGTLFYRLSERQNEVQILAWDQINSTLRNNSLFVWNQNSQQIDSININNSSNYVQQAINIRLGDTTLLIGQDSNQKSILFSIISSNNSSPLLKRRLDLGGHKYVVLGAFQAFNNEVITYGTVDSNYNQQGRRLYPFIIKYNYLTNGFSESYLFDRGVYSSSGIPISLIQLNNGEFALGCDGCKKYQLLTVPHNFGFADLAILDANFNVLQDTSPIIENYSGFPFYDPQPRFQGPQRISGIQEMTNGDLVFLGVIRDTMQARFKDRDIVITRWDRNLNKVAQQYFGTADGTDYMHYFRHLTLGFDGYLYAVIETNFTDSLLGLSSERQKILVAKFDQQLNLIWQETYDSGAHMEFQDMIPTLHGVYLTANQRDFNGPYEKATLLRIKNSSPPVSVNNLVQKYAVDLYPNPATTNAYLNSTIVLSGYQLYDLSGKLLAEKQVEPENRIEVNTDLLAPGMYIVQPLAAEVGKILEVKRLVKYY